VFVSTWPPSTTNRVDERGFVSVGRPGPGIDLRILAEGAGDRFAEPAEVGEILVRTDARCLGYWGNPEETARLFHPEGYLHTGDLGYLDRDGFLYIVGRKKNVILTGGRTIGPREIEEIVEREPMVRFSAALGVDRGGLEGEQVHVLAEIRTERPDGRQVTSEEMEEAARRIVADVHERMGLRPARVLFLRPKGIPLTHNGKVQHALLREKYVDGRLRVEGTILFPDA
jgi:acyl-CoA synthetase (AMP-forming)/AMP-acid ligase II